MLAGNSASIENEGELDRLRDGKLLKRAIQDGHHIGKKNPHGWVQALEELVRRQNELTQNAATVVEKKLTELSEALKDVDRERERAEREFEVLSRHPGTGQHLDLRRSEWYSRWRIAWILLLFLVDLVATSTMVQFIFDIALPWAVVMAIGIATAIAFGVETLLEELQPPVHGAKPGPTRFVTAIGLLLLLVAGVMLAWLRGLEVARLGHLPGAAVQGFFIFLAAGIPPIAGVLIYRYRSASLLIKPLIALQKRMAAVQAEHDHLEKIWAGLLEWTVDLPEWHKQRVDLLVSVFLSACDEGYSRRGGLLRFLRRRKRRQEEARPWDCDKTDWPNRLTAAISDSEELVQRLRNSYVPYDEELRKRKMGTSISSDVSEGGFGDVDQKGGLVRRILTEDDLDGEG